MKISDVKKGFISIPILIGAILLISISSVAAIGVIKYKDKIQSISTNISSTIFKSQNEITKEQITDEKPIIKAIPIDEKPNITKLDLNVPKRKPTEITIQKKAVDKGDSVQQPVPQPVPTSTPVIPQSITETDYSNVCVELYLNTTDVMKAIISDVIRMKSSYEGIKQIWQDEITRNQVYLQIYPNDYLVQPEIKIFQAAIDYLEEETDILDMGEQTLKDSIRNLQGDINFCKNNKINKQNLDKIFNTLDLLSDRLVKMETVIKERYNGVIEVNRKVAITIDTVRDATLKKVQQHLSEINNSISETNRIIQQSQAVIQQAQNAINSINASGPTSCTALRVTINIVNITCH